MPPEPSLLPAFVFGGFVVATFIAFLWYGCGLRDYRKEQRAEELRLKAEQRQLQEIEEARRSEVRPMAILPRIERMREQAGNCPQRQSETVCSSETRAEIRKEVANAQFFRRRRKALIDEDQSA